MILAHLEVRLDLDLLPDAEHGSGMEHEPEIVRRHIWNDDLVEPGDDNLVRPAGRRRYEQLSVNELVRVVVVGKARVIGSVTISPRLPS